MHAINVERSGPEVANFFTPRQEELQRRSVRARDSIAGQYVRKLEEGRNA